MKIMIGTILNKVEHNITVVFFILHNIIQYTIIVDLEGLDVVKHFFLLLNKSFLYMFTRSGFIIHILWEQLGCRRIEGNGKARILDNISHVYFPY